MPRTLAYLRVSTAGQVRDALAARESVAALARKHGTSRQTIMRVRDGMGDAARDGTAKDGTGTAAAA